MAKPDSPRAANSKKNTEANELLEWLKALGLAMVVALGVRQFITEPFRIPSDSMVPTLQKGDRLFVSKLSYLWNEPQRGDIIVFLAPDSAVQACRLDQRVNFIKRIVAVPGDVIEVRPQTAEANAPFVGQVYLNGEPLEEPYLDHLPNYTMPPIEVLPDQVLVMGDNRSNSCDGHVWGVLPEEDIVGRAVFRHWPPSRVGAL